MVDEKAVKIAMQPQDKLPNVSIFGRFNKYILVKILKSICKALNLSQKTSN